MNMKKRLAVIANDVEFPLENHRRLEFSTRVKAFAEVFNVTIISIDTQYHPYCPGEENQIHRMKMNWILTPFHLTTILKTLKVDAVFCDNIGLGLFLTLPRLFLGFKLISFFQGYNSELIGHQIRRRMRANLVPGRLERAISFLDAIVFNSSDGILCVAPNMISYARRHSFMRMPSIQFIPHSLSHVEQFIKQTQSDVKIKKRMTGSEWVGPKILFVGVLEQPKMPDLALDVVNVLLRDYPNSKLIYIGDGGYRKDLERLISSRGLGEHAILLGTRPQREVLSEMQEADLLIAPSISEGFGLAVGEAMALGCPVVGFNNRGMECLSEAGRNAIAIQTLDANDFSENIKELLSNEKKTQEMIERAKKSMMKLLNLNAEQRNRSIIESIASWIEEDNKIEGLDQNHAAKSN